MSTSEQVESQNDSVVLETELIQRNNQTEVKDAEDRKYQDTFASHKTIRKEYKDLAEMLAKSIKEQESEENQKPPVTAFDKAWFGSHLGFSWITPVIKQMYNDAVAPESLALSESEKSDTSYTKFRKNWEQELQTSKPSLMRALKKSFLGVFLKAVLLKLLWGLVLVFTMGILIRQLILFVSDWQKKGNRESWEGYVIAVSFLIASLLLGFFFII